ncbi:AAA-domain-containing protein [Piedraia hortae CBS 480.64]|uniref:AAA-domain-containing protein n=1 Tax=Piedraia hortae CBS 480.64 TaxID=1314780 RepID=A0A6A7BUW3_9PEZI|nr:AAA-domain-containing protein [Piedraia hortae CBS 480.64]
MVNRAKRKIDDFDPNASDPEDLDFDEAAVSPARPSGWGKPKKKAASRRPTKKRRQTYADSEGEVEADSVESSDDLSFSDSSAEVEINPRTGRSVRSTTKKPVRYNESSDAEVPQGRAKSAMKKPATSRRFPGTRKSLIVTLKVPKGSIGPKGVVKKNANTKRSRTPQSQTLVGMRRSSRIAHEEIEPLVALTNYGPHDAVEMQGERHVSKTPESVPSAQKTGRGRGLKQPPVETIVEASDEDSQTAAVGGEPAATKEVTREEAPETPATVEAAPQEPEAQVEEALAEVASSSDAAAEDITVEGEAEPVVQESADENEEDEGPVTKSGRQREWRRKTPLSSNSQPSRTSARLRARKASGAQSSDFEPDPEGDNDGDEDESGSDVVRPSQRSASTAASQSGRRSGRIARKSGARASSRKSDEDEIDLEEIADEVADLEADRRRNRRTRKSNTQHELRLEPNLRRRGNRPDYRILRPELLLPLEDDDAPAAATTAAATGGGRGRRGGAGAYRTLFSTFGPFGGAGGPQPVLGGPDGALATAGVDSDSSDDELGARGLAAGATGAQFASPLFSDAVQGVGGGPPNLGKVKDRKALADADPLGVDTNVSFEGVGGLENHIDRVKEMVALPLLYPEIYQRFKVTPPRGVLFHGPPGTGKTLLARALAASVSSEGKKVTFYMRKGADTLSKWVGEAEKQLRLLFEEARKNQPSIIFFDEIDGLAPVRSSKQEQIHASIVATLLALMDGMDGRGQVIVIGATNRPDAVDPALRRPGRFDREFYFPLPDVKARRAILDIHTKGWDPPLRPEFKDQLADLTKGYGGADLRALCTEAALNAVQGTFPQIYASDKKLVIDPSQIKVLAKDFMLSVSQIVPSSQRSAASTAAALPKDIEPLLRQQLVHVTDRVGEVLPRKRKISALEEAMYDDREDDRGFAREAMLRQFEASRVFRPRLLISGLPGMGQQHLGAALLSKLEGIHVQNFGLAVLMQDSGRSPEAAIVQLFEEVKTHKPSIIYLPSVDLWWSTMSESAIRTFTGLLHSLAPTDPILVLGIMDRLPNAHDEIDKRMMTELFPYSQKNHYKLDKPSQPMRNEYFQQVVDLIRKSPTDYPDAGPRKKRKLAELPVAEEQNVPKQGPNKMEQKAQKKKDRQTLNMLKLQIQSVMDHIKVKYRKFRTPVVDDSLIGYLYEDGAAETGVLEGQEQPSRPYELDKDEKGVLGLKEVVTGKFYYNLEIVTIEKRLSNGYYKRPKDFLADIKRLAKDAKVSGDADRTLKANELLANVEVDMAMLEQQQPALVAECEAVYRRELEREKEQAQKAQEAQKTGEDVPVVVQNVPPESSKTTDDSGPVVLGQQVPGRQLAVPSTPRSSSKPGAEQVEETQQAARSQRGVHTQLAQGSQAEQYHNSASTTTSGNKTRSSGMSNGLTRSHPNFAAMESVADGDPLPDTQEQPQSSSHSNLSQTMPPPGLPANRLSALLNPEPGNERYEMDATYLENFHMELTRRSSGMSVDQLEQINAAMMTAIWESRGLWDRNLVIREAQRAFNETVEDLASMQTILQPTPEDKA